MDDEYCVCQFNFSWIRSDDANYSSAKLELLVVKWAVTEMFSNGSVMV